MSSDRWRNTLGWSQLICGGFGAILLPMTALRTPAITDAGAYLAGALMYVGLTAAAGIGLLRSAAWAVPLSAFVQIPQIVWFATPSFMAKFVCGLMLLIQWTPGRLSFRAGFEVSAWLGGNPGPETHFLVINLFALLALRALWAQRRGFGLKEGHTSTETPSNAA